MGAILKNGINYTNGNSPTKTSELVNDSGFITKIVDDLVNYYKKTETYTKGEIDTIVTAIKNSRFEVVATLPTSDIKTNVIYLVPKADAESGDIKDEYINLDGTTAGWEKIGSTEVDLSGYVTTTALNTALANYTTTTDLTALLAGKQDKVQYSVLPAASAELEGKIFEYTGATGNGLTHGYFYECVSDGQDPATYSWVQTNVQPSGGGGSSYTAGDGIDITEDVISTKQSEEGDIDEIIDTYPTAGNLVSIVNAFNKGDIYSTDEKMIGQWVDGKPLYQKTYPFTFDSVGTSVVTKDVGIFDASFNVVNIKGFATWSYSSNSGVIDISSYGNDSNYIRAYTQGTTLKIDAIGNHFSNQSGVVIIQYTKTTDTAISIGEETEYSTDEKVVGTWIDGKPIYQKTFVGNFTPSTTQRVYTQLADLLSLNIDNPINCNGVVKEQSGYFKVLNVSDKGEAAVYTIAITDDKKLSILTSGTNAQTDYIITLQYTKTT